MATSKKKNDQTFDALPLAAKIFLLIMILGFLSAIYFFALHMPISDELAAAQSQHRQLRQDLSAAEQRWDQYLEISQQLASREALDRANKRVLPEDAEIPAFLQDLNRVAELSGLEIRLVEPRPEQQAEHYVRIPVQLSVSGRFHQIAKFFYSTTSIERAINMENVSLHDPEVSESDEVILQVDALATTFRRPPNAAAPQAAQPAQPAAQNGGAQ